MGAMAEESTKAIVRKASEPVPPGALCVLVGDGWAHGIGGIRLRRISDTDAGEPNTGCLPSYEATFEAPIAGRATPHVLTFEMPSGHFGVFEIGIPGCAGDTTQYIINRPKIDWLSTDQASPGDTIRLVGKGLVSLDQYGYRNPGCSGGYGGYVTESKTKVMLMDDLGNKAWAEVIKASSYDVQIKVPTNLRTGCVKAYAHNGHGGPSGWSDPMSLTLVDPRPWPNDILNVADFGARGDSLTDNTAAFQRALDEAGRNGGGIVLVPPGRYHFHGGLSMPRYTVLKGTEPKRVWLELPTGLGSSDGTASNRGWGTPEDGLSIPVFISGDGFFGLEGLNIMSVYSPFVVGAPTKKGIGMLNEKEPGATVGWNNMLDPDKTADCVFVRNCTIIQEPTHAYHVRRLDDPILAPRTQREASVFEKWVGIAIQGNYCEITSCEVRGAGTAIGLFGSRCCRVSGNTMYPGNQGNAIACIPRGDGWETGNERITIEDNVVRRASNQSHSAAWFMGNQSCFLISGNHIEPLGWFCDNEGWCFHIWGGQYSFTVNTPTASTITVSPEQLAKTHSKCEQIRSFTDNPTVFKNNALSAWECTITGGKGLGQSRRVTGNTGNTVFLEEPWETQPNETSVVCLSEHPKFHKTIMVGNVLEDGGRGLYYWGNGFDSVVDGNRLRRNTGILFEDLGLHYPGFGDWWEFAGHYFNQVLHNEVGEGQGFGYEPCVVGASGGRVRNGVVSLVVRGNKAMEDTCLVACPAEAAPDGLNYVGVVFENNVVEQSKTGLVLGGSVEAVLKGNAFTNIDTPMKGEGVHIRVLDTK